MSMEPTRHGDLVIYPIKNLPDGLVGVPGNVVRQGSSDGGNHVLSGGKVLRAPGGEGPVYLDVGEKGMISHELRHETCPLPPGPAVVQVLVVATDAGAVSVVD